MLYGADLAKREIAHRRQAVIVEGYTDVMACHLAGVPTAVATCGTRFGEEHVKILRRLIMDPDGFRRRGDLHLRRRRGRPEGGAARVRPGAEVRHPDLRRRPARRSRPVRPAAQARRRARSATWSRAGSRSSSSRSTVRARQARPRHYRRPAGRTGRGRPDRRADQGPGLRAATRSTSTAGSALMDERFVLTGSASTRARRATGPAGQPGSRGQRLRPSRLRPASCKRTAPSAGPGRRGRQPPEQPVRPLRPGAAGGAGGAEAGRAVAGAVRSGVRRARRGGLHRALCTRRSRG